MPDIDGWELFKRTAAMRTKMVFIFMTGYGNIPDSADSIRKGVFDYLEKPFSSHKLKCVVNSAIDFLDTLARTDISKAGWTNCSRSTPRSTSCLKRRTC